MIPTEEQAKVLWDTYHLSDAKRKHSQLVARVALFFAHELLGKGQTINTDLLHAAALLHDIDKNIPEKPGERHPDGAVRILREEGMDEVAQVVKKHSLHAILDPRLSPTTWEEKLLFLADKMVKQDVIGIDRRFALWRAENLPPQTLAELDAAYPKVKALEREVTNNVAGGILEKEDI